MTFSALLSSKIYAILLANKRRVKMGSDLATTMKICWVYKPLEYDPDNLPARAKLKEIVVDSNIIDFITKLSLSSKMAVDDKHVSYNDNRVVWTLEVAMISRGGNDELLKHQENLSGEVDTLVDVTESDEYGYNSRTVAANGKIVFEEEWHENCVNGRNKPSEDFNKTTEDFIIDEFMPNVRIKMTLNQGL